MTTAAATYEVTFLGCLDADDHDTLMRLSTRPLTFGEARAACEKYDARAVLRDARGNERGFIRRPEYITAN